MHGDINDLECFGSMQEPSRSVRNEGVDEMDTPCQVEGPGSHVGEQVELRVDGGDGPRQNDPDGFPSVQGRPVSEGTECIVDPNAQCRDIDPSGYMGKIVEWRVDEGDGPHGDDVDSFHSTYGRPESERNQRVINTIMLCRYGGPGGHLGELAELRVDEGDRPRRNNADGFQSVQERPEGVTT